MFNNPIVKLLLIFLAIGAFMALIELFGGDVFRIFEVIWEWIISLVTKISEWFQSNGTFRKIASGPNG